MDIVVLSETKKKGKGEEEFGNYLHFWSGLSKDIRAKAGVSILIRSSWRRKITNWEFINERIITIDITLLSREVVIIGVYAPTNDMDDNVKDAFWDTLRETIEKIPQRKEIILMGDMKARVGCQDASSVVGKFGERELNDNGGRLIEICEQFSLKITNTFFQHRDIHKYTWQQDTRQLKSIIDYIITKQTSTFMVNNVRVYRGAICGSDHYLLKMECFWPWRNQRVENHHDNVSHEGKCQEERFNIELLHDESITTLLGRRLDTEIDESFTGNTEEIYDYITKITKKISGEVLGIRINKDRRDKWWSDEIEQAILDKRLAFHKWLNTENEEDNRRYRDKKNEVAKKIRTAKNEEWERVCADVNSKVGFRRSAEAWSVLKNLRNETQHRTKLQLINMSDWMAHFQKLLNEDREEFIE